MDRLRVIERVLAKRVTQGQAAEMLGLSVRQVRRLCTGVRADGFVALGSKKRGRASNRRLPEALKTAAVELVRDRYEDFGPTLAQEKLAELHGIGVSRETLRKWLTEAGIWVPRAARRGRVHQPRRRRDCRGELVQIDGSDHEWFEDRGARCTVLAYVDDATGSVMQLHFAESESAFDYFAATEGYLAAHGRPVALYSDKHSVFRVAQATAKGSSEGITQFGRALEELNVDIIWRIRRRPRVGLRGST